LSLPLRVPHTPQCRLVAVVLLLDFFLKELYKATLEGLPMSDCLPVITRFPGEAIVAAFFWTTALCLLSVYCFLVVLPLIATTKSGAGLLCCPSHLP
jgi:hypothetical protein